jgi:hypothetical protein
LPAKTACQSTDSSQAECVRQQAGSYSRLHSASKASADGEIGVSRDWTLSVMGCIPTRSVGTSNSGVGNRGFDGWAGLVGAGLVANRLCQATDFNLAHRVRQQAGSYRALRFGVDLGQF